MVGEVLVVGITPLLCRSGLAWIQCGGWSCAVVRVCVCGGQDGGDGVPVDVPGHYGSHLLRMEE